MAPGTILSGNGAHQSNGSDANRVTATANGQLNGTNRTNGSSAATSNGTHIPNDIPIAIVGMAFRLPGGIRSEEALWDTLVNKKDQRQRVPADRWNVDAFHSNINKRGSVKTKYGYFLDDSDIRQFDTSFFSMTRNELERLDPSHRLLLEVTREAFESAGETDWRGKKIGCYVGVFGDDWQDLHNKDTQDFGMYRIMGSGDFVLANRVSYEYDLKGPRQVLSTRWHPGRNEIVLMYQTALPSKQPALQR